MAEPMKDGTQVGQIKTSMNSANTGKKSAGGNVQSYGDKHGVPATPKAGGSIKSPATKNSYKGGA